MIKQLNLASINIMRRLESAFAPPKRTVVELRRNIAPGDRVLCGGEMALVADIRVGVYSGKEVLLCPPSLATADPFRDFGSKATKTSQWRPIAEVWPMDGGQ